MIHTLAWHKTWVVKLGIITIKYVHQMCSPKIDVAAAEYSQPGLEYMLWTAHKLSPCDSQVLQTSAFAPQLPFSAYAPLSLPTVLIS